MIELINLRKIFNQGDQKVVALDDVSLNIKAGEIFGVLGQSGAGKSTLIRCVNQLEKPTSGSVWVNGQEMTALSGTAYGKLRLKPFTWWEYQQCLLFSLVYLWVYCW